MSLTSPLIDRDFATIEGERYSRAMLRFVFSLSLSSRFRDTTRFGSVEARLAEGAGRTGSLHRQPLVLRCRSEHRQETTIPR